MAKQNCNSDPQDSKTSHPLVAQYCDRYLLRTDILADPPEITPRRVRIPMWCVAPAANHVHALVLGQLLYWLTGTGDRGQRRAHRPDRARGLNNYWIAKPARELADETGLTEKQVEHALASLRQQDLIGSHPMRFDRGGELAGMTVSHVWLGSEGQSLYEQHDGGESIHLLRWSMAATAGDLNAALVLSRLWHLAESRGDCDLLADVIGAGGRAPEVVERQQDLVDRLLLSRHQVKRALATLRKRKLILPVQRRRSPVGRLRLDVEQCAPFVLACSDFNTVRRAA